jgi:hypothetical protein
MGGGWGSWSPDWGGWEGSPDPFHGDTSGCVWCGKRLVVVSLTMTGGFQIRVLDGANTWSLIRPGTRIFYEVHTVDS